MYVCKVKEKVLNSSKGLSDLIHRDFGEMSFTSLGSFRIVLKPFYNVRWLWWNTMCHCVRQSRRLLAEKSLWHQFFWAVGMIYSYFRKLVWCEQLCFIAICKIWRWIIGQICLVFCDRWDVPWTLPSMVFPQEITRNGNDTVQKIWKGWRSRDAVNLAFQGQVSV